MDLRTGATEWTYFTGAPIRLAPTVVNGRVYFGSDDGHVYCVNAATGKTHWQFRAGAMIFDVQFNGTTVLTDVTLTRPDGQAAAAVVHDVKDVNVTDNLKNTLVAKQGVPLLNAVKVLRNE